MRKAIDHRNNQVQVPFIKRHLCGANGFLLPDTINSRLDSQDVPKS